MILGLISDTHEDNARATPHIINQFKKRGVELIIHCGDIEPQHLNSDLYGNLPVVCALVDDQINSKKFKEVPVGWQFTISGKRVLKLSDNGLVYVGHKRPFDFLTKSEEQVTLILDEIRRDFDGLRWVFGGHTHFQTYKQGRLISLVNPGAVTGSFSGTHEYSVIDTSINQVVFSRILPTPDLRDTFSVGIISDSYDISYSDASFWGKLAAEFQNRGVTSVIHCGNIAINDIGHIALKDFQVYSYLRPDQSPLVRKLENIPSNWQLIDSNNPIVEIGGYNFFVQLDLGLKFLEQSEASMDHFTMEMLRKHPETHFVLCGFTNDALFVGGSKVRIINPGDINCDRNFVVACLPRGEFTFGHVPVDSLLPIELI